MNLPSHDRRSRHRRSTSSTAIHDAIRDGDADAAAAALDRHIDTLEHLYRQVGVL